MGANCPGRLCGEGSPPPEVWLYAPKAPTLRPSLPRSRPEGGSGRHVRGLSCGPRSRPPAARAPRPPQACPSGRGRRRRPRSAHRGGRAWDPASLLAHSRPPCLSRRPEPRGASRSGEEEDHEFLERDQLAKCPGERAADARPTGVVAPGPRAAPVPAPRPPRPAAWPRAWRCRCCASQPSGRPPLSCSACPGPQVGPAGPRLPGRTSSVRGHGAFVSCVFPFLRDSARAAAPAPLLPREGRLTGPLRTRLGPAPLPAPRRAGLLSIRRALGTAKCFQRPGRAAPAPAGSP